MITFLFRLADKLIFACSAVAAMQLPALMQQYTQRLAGHLAEANYQLEQYQSIADNHYQSNLSSLVVAYRDNSDAAIRQTGELVYQLIDRVSVLTDKVNALTEKDYLTRLYYFVSDIEPDVLRATIQDFEPSLPLTVQALSTGVAAAIIVTSVLSALIALGHNAVRRVPV
ncbi:DUF2937 family protein [Thalassotalea ponticola]|uniref:DUF2937 family protein n=1 Tax=Thalassotalea ponticola TaxID=1523392 RepID=UPI0025B42CA5|nr:DUF2937 family protein [Thalassotalea ponticola]MDN3651395.1 DUF2937 family protein [Thalassotalea ponticola]